MCFPTHEKIGIPHTLQEYFRRPLIHLSVHPPIHNDRSIWLWPLPDEEAASGDSTVARRQLGMGAGDRRRGRRKGKMETAGCGRIAAVVYRRVVGQVCFRYSPYNV